MTFQEAIEKIDSLQVFGSKPGLDRLQKLLNLMGDPQNTLRYIHVAGTNGKGSVCYMLANVLKEAGYRTGLFTSPHIVSFGERMQIGGEPISEEDTALLTEEFFPLVEQLRESGDIITEFEFVTAIAFVYFSRKACDVVVLETGLGGRLDATNVIETPLCSVITSISYDHTAVLGNTLPEIAAEKCGIIKRNGRTVFLSQDDEVNSVVMETVRRQNNVMHTHTIPEPVSADAGGTTVMYGNTAITIPLLGRHQLRNTAEVFAAVDALRAEKLAITDENVKDGIEGTRLPARFERISSDPLIIIDGAHNPGGMAALGQAIDDHLSGRSIVCVIGMLRDKDCRTAAANLQSRVSRMVVTTVPDSPRSQTAEQLCETLADMGFDMTACEDSKTAVDIAAAELGKTEKPALLVCGSLYLAAALREYILNKYAG